MCECAEYAGSPALRASDKPVADVSDIRRRLPPMRWRRTPASASGNPFKRASRSAVGGGTEASDAGPSMHPGSRSGESSRQRPVGGQGHQFRREVNQPELRVSSRVSPRWIVLPFHASVTRRAAFYESHPRWVSIQPAGTKAAEADPRPSQGPSRAGSSPGSGSEASSRMPSGPVRPCPRGKCRPAS